VPRHDKQPVVINYSHSLNRYASRSIKLAAISKSLLLVFPTQEGSLNGIIVNDAKSKTDCIVSQNAIHSCFLRQHDKQELYYLEALRKPERL